MDSNSAMHDRRIKFFKDVPAAGALDAALRSGESNPTPLFFVSSKIDHLDIGGSSFALGRLGPEIERQFSLNGEIAFIFTSWTDFQRRAYNAIVDSLPDIASAVQERDTKKPARFTPSRQLAVLVSPDPAAASKVEEWQNDNPTPLQLIVLNPDPLDVEKTRTDLLTSLREARGLRDLYSAQKPVSGENFFGRRNLLRDVSASIRGGENIAVLGLRRSGKTSIIKELKEKLAAQDIIITLGDFEHLNTMTVETVAGSVVSSLQDDLRSIRDSKDARHSIWLGSGSDQETANMSLQTFSDRMKRLASRNPDLTFVLALDEIEHAAQMSQADPDSIRSLLGALRTIVQGSTNVSLAFAGVATRLFENARLGSGGNFRDNPMFGQVKPFYLSSFERSETRDLLRILGRPMFLEWSEEAIDMVHDCTGGMPYFVRGLASSVRNAVRAGTEFSEFSLIQISADQVATVLPSWRDSAGHDWNELVDSLSLHHPAAACLLDSQLTDTELANWAKDPEMILAAGDLAKLGLLVRSSENQFWCRSSSLVALQQLAARPLQVPAEAGERTPEAFLALARSPESQVLEFKESFRVDVRKGSPEKYIERAFCRAVAALLNTEGGHLLVGVRDNGEVVGLEPDEILYRGDLDRLEQFVHQRLSISLGASTIAAHVSIWWPTVTGVTCAALQVTKSENPVWLDDEEMWIRLGNQTQSLKGRKLQDFLSGR